MEQVILINQRDEVTGFMEKMEAHRKGLLHRAFSVLIFNDKGELLLQKRNPEKYHSGGLWTNTCCGHPRPGEDLAEAAVRRLQEEMGFTTLLQPYFNFLYKTSLEDGLEEHELDWVFTGRYRNDPMPDPAEASDWKYATLDTVQQDAKQNPERYTYWFKLILQELTQRNFSTATF